MTKEREEDLQAKLWAERVQGDSASSDPEWTTTADMNRSAIRNSRVGVQRGRTVRSIDMHKGLSSEPYPDDVERPRTRGECGEERPCPFVSCRYNLYLDVNPANGSMKLNFPYLEVWEMEVSCVLDVAERGGVPGSGLGEGITLEDAGPVMNLTRERIRQLERSALARIRRHDVKHNTGLHEHAKDEGLGRKVRHLPVAIDSDEEDTDASSEETGPANRGA